MGAAREAPFRRRGRRRGVPGRVVPVPVRDLRRLPPRHRPVHGPRPRERILPGGPVPVLQHDRGPGRRRPVRPVPATSARGHLRRARPVRRLRLVHPASRAGTWELRAWQWEPAGASFWPLRDGKPWTKNELLLAARPDLTDEQLARILQRSGTGVVAKRKRLLGVEYDVIVERARKARAARRRRAERKEASRYGRPSRTLDDPR